MKAKKVLMVAVLIFATTQLFSQNNMIRNKGGFEVQAFSYNEIFYSSNLSILNNNTQKTLLSSNSAGVNIRYNVLDIDTITNKGYGAFAGLTYSGTRTLVSNDETVRLYSLGLIAGYSLQWSNNFSADFFAEVDWARYKNEFTYNNIDYTYNKNGMKTALGLTAYASPFNWCRIGLGLKYNIYTFNKNKAIEGIDLSLPKDAVINSLTPFITLAVTL